MLIYKDHIYRSASTFSDLYLKYRSAPVKFAQLPTGAQKAIRQFYVTEAANAHAAAKLLDYSKWSLFEVPTQELIDAVVLEDVVVSVDWDSWEDYHNWYLQNLDTEKRKDRWPLIIDKGHRLGNIYQPFIEDGWHRFHSYVARGESSIPILVNEGSQLPIY